MCALLNMYIINTNVFYRRLFLIIPFIIMDIGNLMAQEKEVQTLCKSSLNPIQSDIFVYLSGGRSKHGNLWTANNNINNEDYQMNGTFFDVGIGTEIYKMKQDKLRLGGFVGYKYEVYGYDKNFFNNSGIYSHWLSTDLNLAYSYLGAGIKSDIFLDSKIKNNDHFTYEGLYSKCFNQITFCYYCSFNLRFTNFKFEARIGSYLKPQFNPDKISYHNLNKTHVDGLFWELKLYYRIFTTGKVYKSPSL